MTLAKLTKEVDRFFFHSSEQLGYRNARIVMQSL